MIGYDRIGVLRAHDVIGTRGGSRTRVGNHTQRGNHTRAVELSLAMRFLVAHHVVVICVAVWFVVKERPWRVSFWLRGMMPQTWWAAREVTEVVMFVATFTYATLDRFD